MKTHKSFLFVLLFTFMICIPSFFSYADSPEINSNVILNCFENSNTEELDEDHIGTKEILKGIGEAFDFGKSNKANLKGQKLQMVNQHDNLKAFAIESLNIIKNATLQFIRENFILLTIIIGLFIAHLVVRQKEREKIGDNEKQNENDIK